MKRITVGNKFKQTVTVTKKFFKLEREEKA